MELVGKTLYKKRTSKLSCDRIRVEEQVSENQFRVIAWNFYHNRWDKSGRRLRHATLVNDYQETMSD